MSAPILWRFALDESSRWDTVPLLRIASPTGRSELRYVVPSGVMA